MSDDNSDSQGDDWREKIPEALRSDPYLERFDSMDKFAQSALEAQALIGRKGVIVPKECDSPDVVSAYR